MNAQDIIQQARYILNDTDSTSYRQSDAELLAYVNDGISEAAMLAPQLFYATADFTCAAGTEQKLMFANCQALDKIIRIKNGGAILKADMDTLSAFNPNWGSDAPGPAVHWFRHPMDPLSFYVYPAASAGQVIELKYVRNPNIVALTDTITDLSQTLLSALVWSVVAKAEMKDDEHVDSGRAVAAYNQFVAMLKTPGA